MSKNKLLTLDLALFVLIAIVFSHTASAVPFQGPVDWAIGWMTGTLARSAAVLAICVAGYLAFVGKLSTGVAFRIILGIVLIFGAATLADLLIGEVG